MEHNKNNNPKDEIDELLYDYFKNSNEDVPIETSKAIDEALYKKKKHSSFNISKIAAIVLLCFTMTTGLIFAKDIINFFSEIFDLKSTNIDNSGIVDAIANKNYIQNVDMDYIPIDDNYSIKVDYLMLDDLNLYLVFNLHSNKKINENYRISITDLKLTDQDGNVIYDANNFYIDSSNTILSCSGWNRISSQNNELRELFYLITNGLYNIKTINLEFSNIIIYKEKDINNKISINKYINFNIDIIEKFIENEIYTFYPIEHNNNFTIEKCIVNNTGLYLLYKTLDPSIDFNFSNSNKVHQMPAYYNSFYYFINIYNIDFNNIDILHNSNTLTLITTNNNKIKLEKIIS